MTGNDTLMALVVVTALGFDFTNGFHDTGNAMATSIATGALPPRIAVALSGLLNLVGAFLSFTVAAATDSTASAADFAFDIDIFGGGVLTDVRRQARDRLGYDVTLPRPLSRNDEHDIVVRYRLRAGRSCAPHYACVPMGRCDLFRLRVRFDRDCPPETVWRVDGVLQRDLDDPLTTGQSCRLDAAGEIAAEFRELGVGLSYGFRW